MMDVLDGRLAIFCMAGRGRLLPTGLLIAMLGGEMGDRRRGGVYGVGFGKGVSWHSDD